VEPFNTLTPEAYPNQRSLKVKIEFVDENGAKYSFNIEGSSKDNINKLIEFAEAASATSSTAQQEFNSTNFSKLYGLLESRFRFGSFTSTDVLRAYEQDLNTPTSLGVISTYLARLAKRGMLTRARQGSGWAYRLARTEEQRKEMIIQESPEQLMRTANLT
jgi:hypothetical protein